VISGIEVPSENTGVQTPADLVIYDAVSVNQDFVSSATDSVAILEITIIKGKIFPASEPAGSWQADPPDGG
jgi:hypothetical protein